MFKRIALLVAASLLMVATARADYVIKDGAGTMRTIKAGTTCGVDVICPQTSLLDGTGAYIGTGANPFAITFGTGVTLPAFATTPTFNLGNINGAAPSANNPLWIQPGTGAVFHVECDAGCSGGGGGGTSSLFGAAFPASGTAIGLSDGTDMVSLRGDETSGAWVNVKASVPIAVTGTFWQATQPVSGTVAATQSGTWNIGSVTTLPAITGTVTANAGTNLNTSALALESGGNLATAATGITTINTNIGSPGATVCATDTASCNLNALLQRNNARISSMITALGSPFQAGGSIGNTSFGISGTLPAFAATPTFNLGTLNGAATAANQTGGTQKTQIVDGSGNVIASTSNNLNVQCANCSGSGVSTADGASFTAGSSLFAGSGGVYQTSATSNPLTSGQQGLFQVTANRALFTNLRNTAGAEVGTSGIPLQVSVANTGANATAIKTDGSAVTQPVSGTVTANLGTLNGAATAANQILTQAPIAPATATATKSDLIGMQYNSTQATFINGQQGSVQGTSRGALYVATGADAFATNATLSAETTKVIGTTRNLGNAGAVIDFAGQNASSPANSWLIGGQFNTTPTTITSGNSSPLQLDNAGNLLVNIKAGASSGAVAQGSTTSGQTGGLMQAAVTTSAPTYTTAQTNPLSMDTSGNLRVSVASSTGLAQGSTTSGQTGSMIMGAVTTSAPTYTTAQTSPISLDTSGNVRMTCSNCSGSGATGTDQGAFTAGSSTFAPGGGFYQTTATSNPLTTGQWGAWQMTANRAGFINLRNASGTEVGTSSAEVFVGGRGTAGSAAGGVLTVQGVASMTPLLVQSGTAPVSTMNSASANSGMTAANAMVFDDVSPTAITENSFGYQRMSANRNAYQTIRDAAGNERGANVDASNRLTTAPSLVSGSVASGAVASGAFASGSIASGAIAAGAQVDLLTMRGTKNAGTAATNSILAGSVYNSTPLTLTDGQGASLQGDANGFLKVNVTNANANGSTTSANSSPVVIASDQAAVAVKAASGAMASGSFASGAFASGSYASGAFASGSLAAGSMVDFLTTRQTVAAGTVASNSQLVGGIYNSTPITMSNGQGAGLQLDANGYVKVNVATGGGSGGTSSNFGSSYPTAGTAMGVRSGANMVAASQANASVAISGNTATTAQLVALSASAVIHVTSFDFMAGGSANVKLVYGTGTNCGTGTTDLTGAYPLTAQAGIAKGSGQGPVLVVPAGNALCWTNSAAQQVSGSLSYTQFVP